MACPKTSLPISIYLFAFCFWSAFAAHKTPCRTQSRQTGYCELFENCPELHNVMLFSDMFNNRYCLNSGLIGAVICCPRRTSEVSSKRTRRPTTTTTKATATTAATTTSTTTTTTTTQPPPMPAAFPSRIGTSIGDPSSLSSNNLELESLSPAGLALLNKNKCGRILTDRVANGVDAGLDELPWVAMLLYGASLKPLCGGSVIAERWVLTAAHCIRTDLNRVRLGEHTVSTERDCASEVLCVTHREFGIEKSIKHPQYDPRVYYKDIALIELDDAIQFQTTINIKPICLPTSPEEFEVITNGDVIIAGWGLMENGESADVLQKGLLSLEQLDVCKSTYSRYLVDDSKICTRAGANDTVSCRGDSGGPLFWKTRYRTTRGHYKERYAQIGLVSTGYMYKCGGLTRVPFMFENVTNSMIWLSNAILN